MNYRLVFRTIRHLKLKQILYQVKNRIYKSNYVHYSAPIRDAKEFVTNPIDRCSSVDKELFTFLNKSHRFSDWNYLDYGPLFAYNQNYFDFINDGVIEKNEALRWIDKFIADIPTITLGMDSYPIALRSINWVKFFSKYPDVITSLNEDSLWSQLRLLQKNIEYHLLGNHLLEDSFALYIGGCYFGDTSMIKKSYNLLRKQLKEQILQDGSHYEQSPMYHSILLDRLLDCINIGSGRLEEVEYLSTYALKMLGHLSAICYHDGDIPLLNDSANNIAPTPSQIFNYAKRLGLNWEFIPMSECGYRKLVSDKMEVIVDVGNITASYQPGHSHADTFNYEMRFDGKPFVVDTGISTYEKNARRQYERSTAAHNTVSVADKDSSEVWGGFRVGRRASVKIHEEGQDYIVASHDGFAGVKCTRTFQIDEQGFIVKDDVGPGVKAKSFIHFAPGVEVMSVEGNIICTSVAEIEIQNADGVAIVDEYASVSYNALRPIKKAIISFTGNLNYKILS